MRGHAGQMLRIGLLLSVGTLQATVVQARADDSVQTLAKLENGHQQQVHQRLYSMQTHRKESHLHVSWSSTVWSWLRGLWVRPQPQLWQQQQQQQQEAERQQGAEQQRQQHGRGWAQSQQQQGQDDEQPRQSVLHGEVHGEVHAEPDWPWQPLPGAEGEAIQTEIDRIRSRQGRQLKAGLVLPHEWPGFLLPERERHLGMAYPGDWGRLRGALARYKQTGNLTIGVVGGSISAGAGAFESHRYMSVCYNKHVPQDVDIVIIEYALNDESVAGADRYDNLVRRAFERLLRKLLSYPNQPAIILLNAYAWFQLDRVARYDGMFYSGADADFFEYAAYYQLPMLSVKTATWRLMQQGVPGFMVNRTRGNERGLIDAPELDAKLQYNMFYWDTIHPNGETGHRAMSDLVVHLLAHADKSLLRRPWSDSEGARVKSRASLPEPMIKGNWESQSDKCFVGDSLGEIVLPFPEDPNAPRFTWTNDQPPGKREKWGYVSMDRGAAMRFKIDARTQSYRRLHPGLHMKFPVGQVAIEIAYLRSYEGVGVAEVSCVSGCICVPTQWDCLDLERKVSLVALFEVKVTMHQECMLQVTNLGHSNSKTDNKQTKVKITGLMISDEGAAMEDVASKDLKSFIALDFVTDGLRANKSFEIQHTW